MNNVVLVGQLVSIPPKKYNTFYRITVRQVISNLLTHTYNVEKLVYLFIDDGTMLINNIVIFKHVKLMTCQAPMKVIVVAAVL